jgi:ribose 1,5-bisphosphokinase
VSGRLIAIVGASGVGKDSVMRGMVAARPALALVRRAITRPADAGGEDFDSLDRGRFERLEQAGAFALSWEAHGLCYGIPASVMGTLAEGRDLLVNLSRGVLVEAQARFPTLSVIHLTATPAVLAARLAARGREDAGEIVVRLARSERGLPPGVPAVTLDNSGALGDTVARALALITPAEVQQ